MAAGQARPLPLPGTEHFINPKPIPTEDDFVALSRLGAGVRWCSVAAAVTVLFIAVYLILDGVAGLSVPTVEGLFRLATNPIIGLPIGILATALVQSSTTVTALTVAAVGTGAISVSAAIPLILGANVGTTITALIVSFSFLGHRENFRRAHTSASLHMWFNLCFVAVAFIFEILFQPLRRISNLLSSTLLGDSPSDSPTGGAVFEVMSPIINTIGTNGWIGALLPSSASAALAGIIAGTILILICVRVLARQLTVLTAATTRSLLERSSGASDALGLLSGALITMVIQASSVTVSSLLPFASTRSLRLREILTITLGANVGTTLTALLTALAVPGPFGHVAIQAALVHVIFNLFSALLVLITPPLRDLLLRLAEFSGRLATRGYFLIVSLMGVFYFGMPMFIIAIYAALT